MVDKGLFGMSSIIPPFFDAGRGGMGGGREDLDFSDKEAG